VSGRPARPLARTIGRVRAGPIVLGILSLVAAAIGYGVAMAILSALPLPKGLAELLVIFVPLLVAGLCMIPFLVPLVDRMAKRDLEAHRKASAAAERAPRNPDAPERKPD
jgi:hypothetical protein